MTRTVGLGLGVGLLVFSRTVKKRKFGGGKGTAKFTIEYDDDNRPTAITDIVIEGYSADETMEIIKAVKSIVQGGFRGEKL